ncbi:MAG: hypothetical protein AB1405_05220 [Bdellovibrionota bacterium]
MKRKPKSAFRLLPFFFLLSCSPKADKPFEEVWTNVISPKTQADFEADWEECNKRAMAAHRQCDVYLSFPVHWGCVKARGWHRRKDLKEGEDPNPLLEWPVPGVNQMRGRACGQIGWEKKDAHLLDWAEDSSACAGEAGAALKKDCGLGLYGSAGIQLEWYAGYRGCLEKRGWHFRKESCVNALFFCICKDFSYGSLFSPWPLITPGE